MSAVRQHVVKHAVTKVMLVEDSAVVRGMVRNWIDGLTGFEVVASAANGEIALQTVENAAPDIIILDIEMPIMDGVTALPGLVRKAPIAKILMASTLTTRNAQVTLRAMGLGACDYIAKPSFVKDGNAARDLFRDELLHKVQGLAPVDAVRSGVSQSRSRNWAAMPLSDAAFSLRKVSSVSPRVVAIGSSTGGPAALSLLFEQMAGKFSRVPVLVAQHMPPTFTRLLAEKLVRLGQMAGGEAEDGQPLLPGHLYLAPGGKHMRLEKVGSQVQISLDEHPPINHCRPAVDPLFESAAQIFGPAALGVVLTGMGSDGANGALTIADQGGTVLVQDERSSVVWGMPGAAAAIGAAAQIIPMEKMSGRVATLLGSRRS